jgi:hypothetical protein
MAINRSTYFKIIDNNVGSVADGLYRKTSPFYKNPGYPAYNPTKAKASSTPTSRRTTSRRSPSSSTSWPDDATATKAFDFFEQQFGRSASRSTPRSLVQSTLINNVIYGEYDCATWNQFGGVRPVAQLRVVRLTSVATASPAAGGLGLSTLPAGTQHRRCGELRPPGRPRRRGRDVAPLAARARHRRRDPRGVRSTRQFAKQIPYLWLDQLVNAWAARSNVQNWVRDGRRRHDAHLTPDAGRRLAGTRSGCRSDSVEVTRGGERPPLARRGR